MKLFAWTLIFCAPLSLRAQSHSLSTLWETDTVVAIPESVVLNTAKRVLYVSLIDGGGWDADGKGGVGLLNPDGTHLVPNWITGLNAPKGLGLYGSRIYVADISEVVVIDNVKGVILKKIPIKGATGLNDITVDPDNGVVYVSDSKAGKVYRIENDIPSLYMQDLAGANGLKVSKNGLYILAKKAVLLVDAAKNTRTITDLPNGGDGVEEVGNGDLIVSEWIGYIYYVHADGSKELLLDTHLQHKNTADIYYDQSTHTLFVPGFNGKTVAAYRLINNKGVRIGSVPREYVPAPAVLSWDGDRLGTWREKTMEGDTTALKLIAQLRAQADKLLAMQPLSVMDKGVTPVGGSKHDYMSQAPYFWPDSSKPNGLPYVNRDGQRNPEIKKITDHDNLADLSNAVQALSLGWYLTKDSKYAEKAAALLQHWFLDTATKMNPNLEYGQAIPGINNGRGIGIIETIPLIGIADAARLLQGSPAWSSHKNKALQNWYAQYLHWMLTSRNGMDEHAATNNHGVWYLAQAVDYALFTGDTTQARTLAEEGKAKIEQQIAADGKMARELARTNSLHYSTYNLRAFFTLARLASFTGVDLWRFTNSQHAGIRIALDWLTPYAIGSQKWEYQEISGYNKDDFYPLLLQAYSIYNDPAYLTSAKLIHSDRGTALTELSFGY